MRRLGQSLRVRLVQSRQRYGEFDVEAEAAFGARPDADGGGNRSLDRQLQLQLAGCVFERTEKAGRISRCEELFGVGSLATGSAQLFGRGKLQFELAVVGAGAAVATSGRGGGG